MVPASLPRHREPLHAREGLPGRGGGRLEPHLREILVLVFSVHLPEERLEGIFAVHDRRGTLARRWRYQAEALRQAHCLRQRLLLESGSLLFLEFLYDVGPPVVAAEASLAPHFHLATRAGAWGREKTERY